MRQDIEPGGAPPTMPFPQAAAIEPHGMLLAIDDAGCIAALAGTTDRPFGHRPRDLLGSRLADTADAPRHPLPAVPPDLTAHPRHVGRWLDHDRSGWDVSAHRSGPYTLLEFEPAPADEPHAVAAAAAIHHACAAFESCSDVQATCAACAKALRQLTGYECVAIGRFAAGTTAVVAAMEEAISMSPPSLVGVLPLPFAPDGDGVGFHAAPDLARLPVPVFRAQAHGLDPDLGHCVLRGGGAAHRAQLERLGVAASLWLPIMVRGRPWGAVACHHATPRPVPCAVRLACELVVRECAMRIEACEAHERQRQAGLLVQEAHHRMQNSLHIVAAMLRLQARQAAGGEVRTELEAAAGRLAAVGAVHRQLSQPDDARVVRLDAYLGQLGTDLAQSWGEGWMQQLVVDACETGLAADTAISLGLVVTELLTNAAKYAYGGAPGPIAVHAARRGTWLHVTVSDRGCGMRSDAAGSGLGSRLNRLFATQLGGEIQWSSDGNGTTATVRIPLPALRMDEVAEPVAQADTG
ncbi:histidine kinase dimerization/phosphoacceptor domain -containing protein [Frateuria sp. YIM B11624]|uniref:histidine kinase dimerization/phosphoacceptor domain -containing protein n=1 Tax=Frateuria sp. YIM B11624 TaxID=3143185 RepID=UPI003C712312